MPATVTKNFEFSASLSQGKKVLGHNYILRATFEASDLSAENGLAEKIEKTLIEKVHSRDLGETNDLALLKDFWGVVTQATRPAKLLSLCLERDRRTQWTFTNPG